MKMWSFLFILSVVTGAPDNLWTMENRMLQLRAAPPRPDSPPSYMVHLYNRYRKGRMPYSAANTVRSFFPTPGKLGSDDILVFNLTGVHPSEYVERVDFHLQSRIPFRKSSRLDQKKSQMQVDVLDLSRPSRPKIATVPLSQVQSEGWQMLDITDSIITCLEGDAEQHHLIGVFVKGPENVDVSEVISQPFIVLFSEDDDHMSIEELDRDLNNLREKRDVKPEILDNELPDYMSEKVDGSLAEVQARIKYKPLDSAVVPRPEARKVSPSSLEKHRKRRRRRRRKDKRLPYAWGKNWFKKETRNNPDYEGDDEDDYLDDESTFDQDSCQKRKLVVNFAEIGWGDWIISPKTFDASYCSGVCSHPLKKNVQSSNHATIQSLIYSMGLKKGIPGLCCVPQSLSSVSLMYYDENRNVILKSYPNMSVESCSCR